MGRARVRQGSQPGGESRSSNPRFAPSQPVSPMTVVCRGSCEMLGGRFLVARSPWACGGLPLPPTRRRRASGVSGRCASDVVRLPSLVPGSRRRRPSTRRVALPLGIARLRFGEDRGPRSRGACRHVALANARIESSDGLSQRSCLSSRRLRRRTASVEWKVWMRTLVRATHQALRLGEPDIQYSNSWACRRLKPRAARTDGRASPSVRR